MDPSIKVIRSDCGAKSHTSSESIALLDEFEVGVKSGDERKLLASLAVHLSSQYPLSKQLSGSVPQGSHRLRTITQSAAPRSYAIVVTSGPSESHKLNVVECLLKLSQERPPPVLTKPKVRTGTLRVGEI